MFGGKGHAVEEAVHQSRYASFFRALRENKLDARRDLAGYALRLSECLDRHLPRLLDRGCTAVICSHDILAHMVLIHCGELGIAVPERLSVIGFDDIPLRWPVPVYHALPLHHPAGPDRAGQERLLRPLLPIGPDAHQYAFAPCGAHRAGLHRPRILKILQKIPSGKINSFANTSTARMARKFGRRMIR